jgi:hypothetical protein
MAMFNVYDSASNAPIAGANAVVKRVSDNTIITSGVTDASGNVDLVLPTGVPCSVLVYKTGAYDGARVSIQNVAGVLTPASIGLTKVTSRQLNVSISQGVPANPLRAALKVKRADNTVFASQGAADVGGNAGFTLPADLTNWKLEVTYPGLDGVVVQLDKIDLIGTVFITLAPVIGPGE